MKQRRLRFKHNEPIKVVGKGELQPGQEIDFSEEDSPKADELLRNHHDWFEEVKISIPKLGKKESESDNG